MALTSKQRIFVKSYLVHKNATQAARDAGYSAKTARQAGAENLTKPVIADAVEKGLRSQERALERKACENGTTKERWLKELARIAFASIDDVALIKRSKAKGYGGHTFVEVLPTEERDPSLGHVIKKIAAGKHGPSIEMHSKQAALDTLGRAYGWVKNELELPAGGIQVILTMPANGSEAPKPTDEKK